jgi:predicted amidohydrolase YtcJ
MIRRLLAALLVAAPVCAQDADLLITNARIWTADDAQPWAEAVAVRGYEILAVGNSEVVATHRVPHTRVVDAGGRLVLPGFIDNHTHFDQAGAILLGVNLLDVADEAGLVRQVAEARDRLPAGAWITGGSWGA